MKLTKELAIKLHRELWDWLYHNPSKEKEDWPKWEWNGGDIISAQNECFLCEYDDQNRDPYMDSCCVYCPLDWVSKESCHDTDSYYWKWDFAKTPKTRKKYAKLIRDLPEKKDIE